MVEEGSDRALGIGLGIGLGTEIMGKEPPR